MDDNNKVCFIISNKYVKGYVSFIDYYVGNIQQLYKDSLIIIVDNNSDDLTDVYAKLNKYSNDKLVILINNTPCKYELGAYKVGIQYLIDNNILNDYNYYIFIQDTFVLKNKYDFNNLMKHNIMACPIQTFINDNYNRLYDSYFTPLVTKVLNRLNLNNNINDLRLCWSNSFVLHKSRLEEFRNITYDINITNKSETCDCERFLSAILYKLNNNINYTIDNIYTQAEIEPLRSVDIPNVKTHYYFAKRLSNKQ